MTKAPKRSLEHSFRVRYAETDQMGWVYHSHYLTWFEMGRTEYMRNWGVPYRQIEEMGLQLPLVKADLRLRLPARYDDPLIVRTAVALVASRQVVFSYEVLRNDLLLATGSTAHLCLNVATGRAVSFPDWLKASLSDVAGVQQREVEKSTE
ncbi:MAG: acyl-CoA thioesterase [Candidatus Eisenbacteria bacterium]|uniref:Acyl-CoA thioesterase n=1 Tax=Eiseniibacteriota bacterium TaxID=2212470 RepID=A0A948RVA0_UNCEI|nr:acyl-CoA thioesterase [Candidatus Eisenbacteria bacterium]MBU1948709.1 acyl-CoA thioesterase [Candidatus Eisenbacteria bacterium]MBU2690208.1 acyl-CoA thioesterase [Candidatus Eisenbacteria bacterium]